MRDCFFRVRRDLMARNKPVTVLLIIALLTIFSIFLQEEVDSSYRDKQGYTFVKYHRFHLTLDDIFIAVKTTKFYEGTRLPLILKTWFPLAKNQTWFFTDTFNIIHKNITGGHMVDTFCSKLNRIKNVCCKTSSGYNMFLEKNKKWYCQFNDDVYVNIPRLLQVLKRYDPEQHWYLGRNVYDHPVYARRDIKKISMWNRRLHPRTANFWYGTFGAGVCISNALARLMQPFAAKDKFVEVCQEIEAEDDVTMGYIIEHLLKKHLTIVPEFHSHWEPLRLIPHQKFNNQVTFSYDEHNLVNVPGFKKKHDSTRILSLHCFLFPQTKYCPKYQYNDGVGTCSKRRRKRRGQSTEPFQNEEVHGL